VFVNSHLIDTLPNPPLSIPLPPTTCLWALESLVVPLGIHSMTMSRSRSPLFASWVGIVVLFILLSICHRTAAENSGQWVQSTDSQGKDIISHLIVKTLSILLGNTVWLAENRRPALYTQNFGDCIGDSLINVTRFDAAYYKDNMTVIFHLAGNTAVKNESLMSEFDRLITIYISWSTFPKGPSHTLILPGADITFQCT
jgi:hypothetical protein